MDEHERLSLGPIGAQSQVGLLLAAMEDSRGRTLRELATVSDPMLTWRPPVPLDSIGQLLYHVALIEADWLLADILALPEDRWPEWLTDEFPIDARDAEGRLSPVPDEPLERALARLERVRRLLLEELRPMSDADLHRPRQLPDHHVTPAWVLHHLLQHEAEHRAHMALVRDLYLSRA
jgi:uncharacterized damage-inducible protein DinB